MFPFFIRHLTSHAISQGPASVYPLLAPRLVQACLPVISQSVCANTFPKVAPWVLEESFIFVQCKHAALVLFLALGATFTGRHDLEKQPEKLLDLNLVQHLCCAALLADVMMF